MRAININSQQWTQFTIPANTNFALITQEQAVCYYAEQNDPTDFFQFKEIVGNLPQEREIWLKTQYGESVVLYVENISTIAGFGGGGGSYTFSAPLNENGGNVSLNLASDLQVSNNNLTLRLSSNSDFEGVANSIPPIEAKIQNLQYQINKLKYPQFDFLEINISPDVIKRGEFSLGEISPTAVGTIPLRNGSNNLTTFGTQKNSNYTNSDIAYNNQDGFFYIGQSNRLVHLFTNNLLNSKLTQGKYTMQFTCEFTQLANWWKNPVYIQVNGNFSTSATDTAFKDNSNRIEVGQFSGGSIPMYAYNWKGGTQQDRSVTLPTIAENQKVSGVSVFNGSTTSVYIRVAGQPTYSLQGTMDATIPNSNNIRAIGFVRGNSDCASIKIYELRFWAGAALTEAEINGKLLDLSMPL